MKSHAKAVLILLSIAIIAIAQSPTEDRTSPQQTQVRGYWVDPSTGLMWAGKDNGKDVTWDKAEKYCRNLRLAGDSNWRLATIDELQGIFDKTANAPGLAGKHSKMTYTWHVKGNLFLTGFEWSSFQKRDDRGHLAGYAWYFDFNGGIPIKDQTGYSNFKHVLCARGPESTHTQIHQSDVTPR